MTFSPEKIAAFEELEKAIDGLRNAYGYDDDVLNAWVLLTNSVGFVEKEDDPNADDLDTRDSVGYYTRRGQSSTLSYGLINEAVRHHNEVQMTWGESDD